MKALKIALVVVVVLAVAAIVAFQVFFRLPVPDYEGRIALDGLSETVEVRTDKHGVPHIFAKDIQNLFFASTGIFR